jgi:hypothetical protein
MIDKLVKFEFNQKKPRKYGNTDAAYKRMEEDTGRKLTKREKNKTQRHHKDLDRSNDHPLNMIIAKDQYQHNDWHNQLHQANSEMIKSGVIGFDWTDMKYFIAFKPLADWIRKWRDQGRPGWHQDEGKLSKNKEFLVQMHQSLFEKGGQHERKSG